MFHDTLWLGEMLTGTDKAKEKRFYVIKIECAVIRLRTTEMVDLLFKVGVTRCNIYIMQKLCMKEI